MFNSIDEVFDWLYNQKKLSKREDLNRIKTCSNELGLNPKYKVIHIAGTNGKGSTASYIKNILKLTGKHVGFFVSPFVVSFNERIQINYRYISNAEIMHYANILYDYSKEYYTKYNDVIPFFELTLLMALMFFKDRQIDIAVIECGVGGLLDATNFINSDLSIITNVGFDHMNTLGNTLESIANHKLGIVKNNSLCLTCVEESLFEQFDTYVKKLDSSIIHVDKYVSDIKVDDKTYFKYKDINFKSSLLGSYQAYNAALAIEAVRYIDPNISDLIIQDGLILTSWPGRMEIIKNNPLVIIDGAHNIHGINGLVNSLAQMKKNKKLKIIFSALQDKAYKEMLNMLNEIADFYYFTSISDLRATPPEEFSKHINKNYSIIYNMEECIDTAINDLCDNEMLVITGSLHFISLVRNYILK